MKRRFSILPFPHAPRPVRPPDYAHHPRWSGIVFSTALHGILVAGFILPSSSSVAPFIPPPAIMLTFAAPQATQQPTAQAASPDTPAPSTPEQKTSPLPLVEKAEITRPLARKKPVQREKPRKKQPVKKTPAPQKEASQARPTPQTDTQSRPSASGGTASTTAAYQTVLSPHARQGENNWRSRLAGHLERHKRYPKEAMRARNRGRGEVRINLDARGNILSARLISGTGVVALDREIMMLMKRASPLPAPPDTLLRDGRVELDLPINYLLTVH